MTIVQTSTTDCRLSVVSVETSACATFSVILKICYNVCTANANNKCNTVCYN